MSKETERPVQVVITTGFPMVSYGPFLDSKHALDTSGNLEVSLFRRVSKEKFEARQLGHGVWPERGRTSVVSNDIRNSLRFSFAFRTVRWFVKRKQVVYKPREAWPEG